MTCLFPQSDQPRVFALPPGVDFTAALVAGLDARLAGQPWDAAARVDIWVNTRRASRALAATFAEGPARLLPRIRVVTELAARSPSSPTPVSPLRRKLELARLVGRLLTAQPELAPRSAVFDLADSLGSLLDELQGEGIEPGVLRTVDPDEHAAHWQRSLRFLDAIAGYAAETGPADGQGRMRAAVAALTEAWAFAPPQHPVIVAGSTGSRGATRAFMAAVARLPQGALVLPGFDAGLPPEVWNRLGDDDAGAADHPQHGFRVLADALGFDLSGVTLWHPAVPPAPSRNALVSLALRPAPVTDQWRAEGAALAGTLAEAFATLSWVEAPDPRREAVAVALVLREAAETGKRAALVTPDRSLARRVTAELDRWGLIPDDSAGRPLALTPPGVLVRRIAALFGGPLPAEDLLALIKHPLVSSAPDARRGHLRLVSALENREIRGGPPWIDWPRLADWAAACNAEAEAWILWLRGALEPLAGIARAPLASHVASHRAALETLAAGPAAGAEHALWEKDAGRQARELLDALAVEAEAGEPMQPHEYRALVQSLLAAGDVPEEAAVTHPGIAIWGTLEARVQSADLVVLGGLNEGIWPRLPRADPWLGRGIRRTIGLPSPERQIGLSAHDFQQATGAAEVVLTRATRDAEAPTVAARWLLRLENLLLGLGPEGAAALGAARARGERLLDLAGRLDTPATPLSPALRPAPRPPVEARPARLSVSGIDRLIQDPYAVYAAYVLGLHRLDPPGRRADALTRGNAIHRALHRFVGATAAGLGDDAATLFYDCLRTELTAAVPWPAVHAIWESRIGRAAGWFLDGEGERRQRGAPAAQEIKGSRAIGGLPHPFSVTARADRIDRLPDGYAIYDYKSGSSPKSKAELGAYLQLPIEAAIAEAGGFEGLEPAPVRIIELLKFGGSGQTDALDLGALPETWARLGRLIRHYQQADNGFVARLRPSDYGGDYDDLARFGEWADGDTPAEDPW